jgi:hypothetical protein
LLAKTVCLAISLPFQDFLTALLESLRLRACGGRNLMGLDASLRHRILHVLHSLIAKLRALPLDVGSGPLPGLWRQQQRRSCSGQAADNQAGQEAPGVAGLRLVYSLGMVHLYSLL